MLHFATAQECSVQALSAPGLAGDGYRGAVPQRPEGRAQGHVTGSVQYTGGARPGTVVVEVVQEIPGAPCRIPGTWDWGDLLLPFGFATLCKGAVPVITTAGYSPAQIQLL